ncbi:hypothetical protein [Xanthobacter autotrophicus]|uniref:hypothetical protein n=1 Tax=Xanthobacter autotrophicus TaxID=280 RepID=UPI00372CA451
MSDAVGPKVPPSLSFTMEELERFRVVYGGTRPYRDRMSTLIWVDMFAMEATYGINPNEILRSIDELEGLASGSRIKPPTQFKFHPLNGLWHKHFFAARFIAHNISLGLSRNGLEKIVREVLGSSVNGVITEEIVAELAHRVTNEPIEKRAAEGKLTGEWIIYVEHEGRNFYLTCKPHSTGDQVIFDDIARHCRRDFPDILKWISEAAATS